jgi:carbon-monoxide dehydrogenase medium subunit
MKPVDFSYLRARSLGEAVEHIAGSDGAAKIMSGGQTLGPMLNLRFVQPESVIDVARIPEMKQVAAGVAELVLGACTTHADVEDGRVPDVTKGMMQRVASGIAYRAVRTRGTIGGSLAHADPAADWVSCLTALDARVNLQGRAGARQVKMSDFILGPLTTVLEPDEVIVSVSVPVLSDEARWGYHKICRKTGEFAEAIGAVVIDGGRCRIVAGATSNRPIVVDRPAGDFAARISRPDDVKTLLADAGLASGHYEMNIHAAAVWRAMTEAMGKSV